MPWVRRRRLGTVLVTYGDVPLRPKPCRSGAFHEEDKNSVTVLTTHIDEPGACERIVVTRLAK